MNSIPAAVHGYARLLSAAVSIAIALSPAGDAAAQQPAPIRVGQPVTGTLSSADPLMLSGNGPFHVYRLDAERGERLVITLRSGAFDAFLGIMHPVGGIHELVARDDDGGGGTDARLRWTAPATATYFVVAQALDRDGRGGYTLLVEPARPTRPISAQPLRIGESRHGELTEESSLLPDDSEIFHDLYAFDARAGQELIITLDSDDFDAFVAVGPLDGTRVDVIANDDDGGGEMNARLRVTIPADGRYGVHARGLGGDAFGRYTLTIREAVLPAPRPLERGRDVSAVLHDDGVDQWLVRGAAGERIRIAMRSGDFDAMLALGPRGDRFQPVAENDDADEDESTDSRIDFTFPAAGEYIIRASAFGGGGGGSYVIRVDTVR